MADRMTAEQLRMLADRLDSDSAQCTRDWVASEIRRVAARLSGMAAVPEGWKLVPVEPTESMDAAAREQCYAMRGVIDPVIHVWDAMLAAAPEPPDA